MTQTLPAGAAISAKPQPARLLDRLRAAIRARYYSLRTEEAYAAWVWRFIIFHHKRHPADAGEIEINQFLTHLAVAENVAASTQNQALSAILFLYKNVLERDVGLLNGVVRARKPTRLPVVLSREELRALLEKMSGAPKLVALLFYGAGLRLMEALRLRVKDIDFATNQITVRQGKGQKDRITMLPGTAKAMLTAHLQRVRKAHQQDIACGFGRVYLPRRGVAHEKSPVGCTGLLRGCRLDQRLRNAGAWP